jgi:hypothetical protein
MTMAAENAPRPPTGDWLVSRTGGVVSAMAMRGAGSAA